jgi:ABC-type transport system substrate-binding protein
MASGRALTLAALCGLASLGGCSVSEPVQPTLQIGVTGSFTHLDPARGTEPGTTVVSRYVFQTLPQIATAVHHSRDMREWTFTIPSGLHFSDGTPLDARAVAANFTRWRLGWYDADGYFVYASAFLNPAKPGNAIDDSRALDRNAFRIRTHAAYPKLEAVLADAHFAIASPTAFAAGDEHFDGAPAGSGPYVIRAWDPGATIVLGPAPYAARAQYASVYVRDIPDPHTAVLALRKFDVEIVYGFPAEFLNEAATYALPTVLETSTGAYCAFAPTVAKAERVCPPSASARGPVAERPAL